MKNILTAVLLHLVVMATPVLAAGGATEGASPMTKLFLAFFALIVVCQLIPGLSLFAALLKGLFGRVAEKGSLAEK